MSGLQSRVVFRQTIIATTISSNPPDLMEFEDQTNPLFAGRIYSVLELQRKSTHMKSHFKNSEIRHPKSEKIDEYLIDQLFDIDKTRPRLTKSESAISEKNSMRGLKKNVDKVFEAHLNVEQKDLQDKEIDAITEDRQRIMKNLQSYLIKGYEAYRTNFFADSQINCIEPNEKRINSTNTSPLIGLEFNVQTVQTNVRVAEQETSSCQFFNFNSQKKYDVVSSLNYRLKEKSETEMVRSDIKEAKQSISTQCSNRSFFNN